MTLRSQILSDIDNVFLNSDEFAEIVVFLNGSGPVTVTAVVDIDEAVRDDGGETMAIYTGQIQISESDFGKLNRDDVTALLVIVRNEKWHIVDTGNEYHGMRYLGIRRQERRLSNAVTLDGKQKRYGKLSPNP